MTVGFSDQFWVDTNIIGPVQADRAEGDVTELLNRVIFAGADDIIIRGGMLQNHMHHFRIVASEAEIAPHAEIPQQQLAIQQNRPPSLIEFRRIPQSTPGRRSSVSNLL
ncbi:hypothetical protein HY68_37555 [Streptomyces sp. AcH 505]|nr:hypothetical protein HY68_37555 [Streptomyces sp. AcH 505]